MPVVEIPGGGSSNATPMPTFPIGILSVLVAVRLILHGLPLF